jgi:hypothetical protein
MVADLESKVQQSDTRTNEVEVHGQQLVTELRDQVERVKWESESRLREEQVITL